LEPRLLLSADGLCSASGAASHSQTRTDVAASLVRMESIALTAEISTASNSATADILGGLPTCDILAQTAPAPTTTNSEDEQAPGSGVAETQYSSQTSLASQVTQTAQTTSSTTSTATSSAGAITSAQTDVTNPVTQQLTQTLTAANGPPTSGGTH